MTNFSLWKQTEQSDHLLQTTQWHLMTPTCNFINMASLPFKRKFYNHFQYRTCALVWELTVPQWIIWIISFHWMKRLDYVCEERHKKTCLPRTCENKGADQLRSNCAKRQCLCFRYGIFSTSCSHNFKRLAIFYGSYSSVCVDPVLKPRRPLRGSCIFVNTEINI